MVEAILGLGVRIGPFLAFDEGEGLRFLVRVVGVGRVGEAFRLLGARALVDAVL
jgi:hypothetical protein